MDGACRMVAIELRCESSSMHTLYAAGVAIVYAFAAGGPCGT